MTTPLQTLQTVAVYMRAQGEEPWCATNGQIHSAIELARQNDRIKADIEFSEIDEIVSDFKMYYQEF